MTIRCQVAFPETLSGMGADLFVNTFHIIDVTAGVDPLGAAEAFRSDLEDLFYAEADDFFSDIVGPTASFKAYDLTQPVPRTPIEEETIIVLPGGGTVLPPELAMVVSSRADYQSGAPKARRRGRTFLGGLNELAHNESTGQLAGGAIATVAAAAGALMAASAASDVYTWAVYSPTDDVAREVVGGWVDNAFDIQRRRGLDPDSRVDYGLGH